ncbi:MAG: helix-turn-helix domain-containing protein [Candidatus Micrarchaeia archaeon]
MGAGRPHLLGENEMEKISHLYLDECMTVREIADILGVSHMTVWRALRDLEQAEWTATG